MSHHSLLPFLKQVKTKTSHQQTWIWCVIRKKWLIATPEEFVRQSVILFLIQDRHYPAGLISVEKKIHYKKLDKRYDIVAFNHQKQAQLLIECKAAQVPLDEKSLDQLQAYQYFLGSEMIWLTNGHQHIFCQQKVINQEATLQNIPSYSMVN